MANKKSLNFLPKLYFSKWTAKENSLHEWHLQKYALIIPDENLEEKVTAVSRIAFKQTKVSTHERMKS